MAQFHIGIVEYYDSKKNFLGRIKSKDFRNGAEDVFRKFNNDALDSYTPFAGDIVIYSSDGKQVFSIKHANMLVGKLPWHEVIKYVGANSSIDYENKYGRTISVKVLGDWVLNCPPAEIQKLLREFHAICEHENTENQFSDEILHSCLQQVFLKKCLSDDYITTICNNDQGKNNFVYVLDKVYRDAINNLDYPAISTIFQKCSNIKEEYYKLIIKSCNELLISDPQKLISKIGELECFDDIARNKKGPYDFRLEVYLSLGLNKGNFSNIKVNKATTAEGLFNWLDALSHEQIVSLSQIYGKVDESFQTAYADFILAHDITNKQRILVQIYPALSNDQKALIIKDYAENEHYAVEYLEEYNGESFAHILYNDDFYQNHLEFTIPSSKIVEGYVEQYIELKDNYNVIREYSFECIKASILKVSGVDAQLSILSKFNLSEDENYRFLSTQMPASQVLKTYGRRIAENKIKGFSYAVFDLEIHKPADDSGDKRYLIKEAGFVSEKEKIHFPSNVSSIDEFFEKLSNYSIIVGHNIKKWDIGTVLSSNGLSFDNNHFIWDTQIIQEILNPFMKCYALNNTSIDHHTAISDAEFTQRLFWNQIVTISEKQNQWIEKILPEELAPIISIARSEVIPHFLENKMGNQAYFKEMGKIGKAFSSNIKKVEQYKSPIIIASRALWKTIREHVEIRFNTDDTLFQELDRKRLSQIDVVDDSTAILHSISLSKRSCILLCDIAPAIRHFFSNEEVRYNLHDFLILRNNEGAICTNATGFDSINERRKGASDAIIFIGQGIEARDNINEHRYKVPLSNLSAANSGLGVIKQFVESSSPRLIDETLFQELTGQHVPQFCANTWIEGATEDTFFVKSNLSLTKYIDHLKNLYPNKVHFIDLRSEDYCTAPIYLLSSERENLDENTSWNNPQMIQRLASSTKSRGRYWAYQLALVTSIKRNIPLVWVIEKNSEKDALISIIKALGFRVPGSKTVRRNIELAYESGEPENCIIVIGGFEFTTLLDSEIKDAYYLVYNNINIESKRVRWHNMIPFGDEPIEIGENPSLEDYVIATWPQLEVYNNLIHLNNPDCKFFLADSVLDCCVFNCKKLNAETNKVRIDANVFKHYEAVIKESQLFDIENENNMVIDEKIAMDDMLKMFKDINPNVSDWKPTQKEILPDIIKKEHNCLICMPTGGGKSILFQLPAMYRSKISGKLSIVIAPLKALLKDQVEDLDMPGVEYLNSDKSPDEIENIYQKIRGGEITLLYMTPERFRSQAFMNALGYRIKQDNGLEYIIFDEAHCISQWGLDFRPDYRYAAIISKNICDAFSDVKIELFTATVTKNVREDISSIILIPEEKEHKRYNPIRNHIGMEFCTVNDDANAKKSKDDALSPRERHRIERIYDEIEKSDFDPEKSSMIIFSTTRNQVENFKEELSKKFSASSNDKIKELAERIECFHGGMTTEERDDIYRKFKGKDRKTGEGDEREYSILVATKAFGMGMNIPDIHYIYHAFPSENIEDYLQEIGRAGRDSTLFPEGYGSRDKGLKQFVTKCFISQEDIRHAKDLQSRSSLKWDEVRDIYSALTNYISKFSKDGNAYISIPTNIWKRSTESGIKDDPTAFKIGLYWLTEAKRIDTRFLTTATYDFEIESKQCPDKECKPIFDFIASKAQPSDNLIQVRIGEIRRYCQLRQNELNDLILKCQRNNWFRLTNKVSFNFSNRYKKSGLASQIIKDEKLEEFHIPFEICKIILENPHDGCRISKDERLEIIKRQGSATNKEVSRLEKIALKIISKLPSVTSIKEDEGTKEWIISLYRPSECLYDIRCLENNTFAFLRHITDISFEQENLIESSEDSGQPKQKKELPTFIWTDAAIKIGADSFSQIDNAVEMVRALGLASIDSLLPTGTEVRLTSNRDDLIPVTLDKNAILDHPDGKVFTQFNQIDDLRHLKLLNLTALSKVTPEHFDEAIKDYFDCSEPNDFLNWSKDLIEKKWLSADDAEFIQKLIIQYKGDEFNEMLSKLDDFQKEVCNHDKDKNLVVLAGPGSGKTRVLTIRCAKMLRNDRVNRDDILVLAYNRGVVSELRARLNSIFLSLGYTKSMSRIEVFTFHSFAKQLNKILKRYIANTSHQELNEITGFLGETTSDWELDFAKYLSNKANFNTLKEAIKASNFKATYFLIDEFQDVTEDRLDILFSLRKLLAHIPGNTEPKFFVVGDINQSIYGYQRVKKDEQGNSIWEINGKPVSISPHKYYQELRERLGLDESNDLKMTLNYRSYEAIIQKAIKLLNSCSGQYSLSIKSTRENPKEKCVFDSEIDPGLTSWYNDFSEIIDDIQNRGLHEVAFLYRTNAELYDAYTKLKEILNKPEWSNKRIRVRIQCSTQPFFRTRECYLAIYHLFQKTENTIIDKHLFEDFERYIASEKSLKNNTGEEYLDKDAIDLTHAIALYCYDSLPQNPTAKELAEEMLETANENPSDLLKIMESYKDKIKGIEKRDNDEIEIILSVMHRVKGLEFEAVVVNPSQNPIGYEIRKTAGGEKEEVELPQYALIDTLDEERRLLYVAYTRAKSYLRIYKGTREIQLENENTPYRPCKEEETDFIRIESGLDKYNKSFGLKHAIVEDTTKNTAVRVIHKASQNAYGENYEYGLIKNMSNSVIGQVYSKGNIKKNDWSHITGLYLNDMYVWRYEDTCNNDKKKGWDNAKNWPKDKRHPYDYVLVPDISGFGIIDDE